MTPVIDLGLLKDVVSLLGAIASIAALVLVLGKPRGK